MSVDEKVDEDKMSVDEKVDEAVRLLVHLLSSTYRTLTQVRRRK